MVKRTLMRKSIMDMKRAKTQFISIFVMATLAVSIVTGLDCIWKTIEEHAGAMYEATNLSDLWVTAPNPTEKQLWGLKRIDGVETAEKRFTMNVEADLKGAPTLCIYTVSDRSTLDRPKLIEGGFESRGGAVLDAAFAEEHGLKAGDEIFLKLNGKWIHFPIEGLALSSEQIYAAKGTTGTLPNHAKFGFIVVNEDILKGAFGQKVYNQISVGLSADADMAEVKRRIDDVFGDDLIGIVERDDSLSANSVSSYIQQFRTLSAVFPLMFFLVTALIMQSTMVRLIESQRAEIGVLKALGYGRGSILWHYTSYGVYMGLAGAVTGLLIGPRVFGGILIPWLRLTLGDDRLLVNYRNFIFSLLLILLCTGGVSLFACLRLQGDKPASLLRERPPKGGSHIFLEFLPKLWNRMKFSAKLIARNTLKNKMRLIMSVLGITGCTGLIIGAFTISDMISGISQKVYGEIYTYDQKVILSDKADSRLIRNKRLDATVQMAQEEAREVICPDGARGMKALTVIPEESPLVHLKDIDGNPVTLCGDGIAMTRKLAAELNVRLGDSILLKRADEGYVSVPVRQIVYMAAGQGMFMTDAYFESLGETFRPTAALVRWNGAPDEAFLKSDYVDEAVNRVDQMEDIASNTRVVYIAAVMLIVMGGILAFVVLYNSSILNFAERIRDLATLRVLGFYQREVRAQVLTENILSVLFGLVLGIPVGKALAVIVAGGLDDRMDLIGHVTLGNVALAGIITLAFALIINVLVAKKMKNIDMLEALKSVE